MSEQEWLLKYFKEDIEDYTMAAKSLDSFALIELAAKKDVVWALRQPVIKTQHYAESFHAVACWMRSSIRVYEWSLEDTVTDDLKNPFCATYFWHTLSELQRCKLASAALKRLMEA